MKELQKKKLPLHKIIIKKEDQAMGPDNGLTIKILPTDQIRNMDRIIRIVDDLLIEDQINSPTETMEIDGTMEIIITKKELGEIMAIFLVRHLDKDRTFLKIIHSVEPNLVNLGIRLLGDQMVTQTRVLLLTNKNSLKVITKHQQTWFASPPLMIVLTNSRNFVR